MQFLSIKYWKTQLILKRKWLLNKWPFGKSSEFQRFIVLCDPRTGSTWLHTLLNSNPQVVSHGEILSEQPDIINLENTIWREYPSVIKSVGCKIFYQQLLRDEYAYILNEIVGNQRIKIIDLTRKDVRAAFNSLRRAESTGSWSSLKKVEGKMDNLKITEEQLSMYEDEIRKNRNQILSLLPSHEILPVSYEELMADGFNKLNELQEFIGVEPTKLFSLLQKQRDSIRH